MVKEYKPLYGVPEVAEILLIGRSDVYALLNSGKLPYLKLGSRKIRGSDLEKFIETYPVANPEKKETA